MSNNLNFNNNFNNINQTITQSSANNLNNNISNNNNDNDILNTTPMQDINLKNPILLENVFNVILINKDFGEETTLEKLDDKMHDFFHRMHENVYDTDPFHELIENYHSARKQIMKTFKNLIKDEILTPNGKLNELKINNLSKSNQIKIQFFNKGIQQIQETIIATLKKEAELYNIDNNNIINSINLNYQLKTNDILEYIITTADLNTILTINFNDIDLISEKENPGEPFEETIVFSNLEKKIKIFEKKIKILKKIYFSPKSLHKRTAAQNQLFKNIIQSLKNMKEAYEILKEHGIISNERITNEKAKEKMEIFREKLSILLKKLCVSLNSLIDPLNPIS